VLVLKGVTRTLALLASACALAAGGSGQRSGSAGVTVALPAGWHTVARSAGAAGHVFDPVARVVAASGPIGLPRGCSEVDYRFAATVVAIVVVEWTGPTPGTRWPPRPHSFTARTLPVRPAPALECWGGPGGAVEFADHGRRFEAFIAAGAHASPAAVRRARAVLDTLRVRP
jgi:hypothetical protein